MCGRFCWDPRRGRNGPGSGKRVGIGRLVGRGRVDGRGRVVGRGVRRFWQVLKHGNEGRGRPAMDATSCRTASRGTSAPRRQLTDRRQVEPLGHVVQRLQICPILTLRLQMRERHTSPDRHSRLSLHLPQIPTFGFGVGLGVFDGGGLMPHVRGTAHRVPMRSEKSFLTRTFSFLIFPLTRS